MSARAKGRELSAEVLKLDNQLCFALYSASRALTRAYQPLLEPLGLTYPQYLVMLVLWEKDGLSVSELGERLSLDSGTLTPLLKRMEESRHLVRKRDTADERVVRVHLSATGKKLRERAIEVPLELACRVGFQPDERGMTELAKLRSAIKELTEKIEAGAT